MTIHVCVPVHNRRESTARFLECLQGQTYKDLRVIICDDGSTDGTGEMLRTRFPWVIVEKGDGNLWWSGGTNVCVRRALELAGPGDYILTINNDVEISSSYLAHLTARAKEFPGAIIGSLCVYRDAPDRIETSGFVMNYRRCMATALTSKGQVRGTEHSGVRDVTHVPGKGVLIPIEVFEKIGLYDEKSLPQYHADTDLTLRAHEAGFRVLLDFDSVVRSDVNLKNMALPDQEISLRGIAATFKGSHSPNNWTVNLAFARKHFGARAWCYVLIKYLKIVSGMSRRYLMAKLRRIRGASPVNS